MESTIFARRFPVSVIAKPGFAGSNQTNMPVPITPELLATYEGAFARLRARYREEGQGRVNWDTSNPAKPRYIEEGKFIGVGPCEVRGNEYRPIDQPEAEWKMIPEIKSILDYLEEMP